MTDAYSLSRKEGWHRWVDSPGRNRPEQLTARQLGNLSFPAREDYDDARDDWHANFGILETPQLKAIHDDLDLIVSSNRQDPDRVRGAAVIDAHAGLGKTTIARAFMREFDRRQRRRFGETIGDHEHLPVFNIGLTSRTTLRTLNYMICEFYGRPGIERATAARLTNFAVDCVNSCGTRIGFIDDLHFINMRHSSGVEVANHLKWLANELAITFIFAGVGLTKRGFFSECLDDEHLEMAQTGRRWTRLALPPFTITTESGKQAWFLLVRATERNLVLARTHPGMLTDISDYLFARTTGHIGSFFTLIQRGCRQAIKTGKERIDTDLLDTVRIDQAAENERADLQASFKKGTLSTQVTRPVR
ncbi:TniB family NTP-binding protein [Glycomyces tritici]|uniref:AAA family ATPase n=1 Tax=Glycomyces tritici TaxID=2665176 RepID=A0ABT7YWL0_9ACTN|nr:TniB family NTP-binding protein [Glycomyces tritici]MDN3243035.1 AAA family ATPase [Glycomyces tritici]